VSLSAIRTDALSKQYRLGQTQPYGTLRDAIASAFAGPVRGLSAALREERVRSRAPRRELLWALRDVSFEIGRGEVVGIIGRNGAGKSTLLKILSRLTEPTSGMAMVQGRVGSLLEVGTGFHAELTGRENVYLNGAILGMRRREINRKFDQIVEFAGTGKFLDTPVKRYSSGMMIRLAFAVAAHLETEILLVDEVLSVGDVEFQRRCLGKMEDVTHEGRTVLFVSHNLPAVRRLCSRAILLSQGQIETDGATADVLDRYLRGVTGGASALVEGEDLARYVGGWLVHHRRLFRATRIAMLDAKGIPRASFASDEPFELVLDYEVLESVTNLQVTFDVYDMDGDIPIMRTQAADDADSGLQYLSEPGIYRSRCRIPANLFGGHRFYVDASLKSEGMQDVWLERVLEFDISFRGYSENADQYSWKGRFRPLLSWDIDRLDQPAL
jgi:homopolymeric O-antigen transport system ATP-binding protein